VWESFRLARFSNRGCPAPVVSVSRALAAYERRVSRGGRHENRAKMLKVSIDFKRDEKSKNAYSAQVWSQWFVRRSSDIVNSRNCHKVNKPVLQ
jgi:hypothetical protein